MMRRMLLASTVCAALGASIGFAQESPVPSLRLDNGYWLVDGTFKPATVFVDDAVLRFAKGREDAEAAAARTIDLGGRYVTPPFCEAHNHNLGSDWENDLNVYKYLRDGVFYVKVLSNLPRESARVWHTYNHPGSVDAQFANGGITGPGGHPIRLRETLLERGAYEGFTKDTLRDHAYFVIDSDADIEAKWPLILQYRPDFLKLFLVHSEEYERRRDDPAFFGRKGLDPVIFGKLVAKAHEFGLHVAVHVATGHDFRVAVAAGADNVAHLPVSREPQAIGALAIDPEDAAEAARRGIVVTTTASLVDRAKERDPALHAELREVQIANLRLLKQAGVTLAIGSDEYDDTSVGEVAHLRGLGVFDDVEILRMWTGNCAATTFPGRRIGRLADGYEASFLVLDGDPLKDFAMTGRIAMRLKDGRLLELGDPPASPANEGG